MVDHEKTWESIKENLAEGLREVFPIVGKKHELHLEKVEIGDSKKSPHDYAAQKKAVLSGVGWTVPVHGTLALKTVDGKLVDKRDKVRLLSLPRLTSRSTIIHNGTEYNIANQMRRKPGVYTTIGSDDVTHAQFNVDKGANFEIWQDHVKGVFFVKFGQASVPLYPILRELGVHDDKMFQSWGRAVLESNRDISQSRYKNAITTAFNKLTYNRDKASPVSYEEASQKLGDVLSKSELSPETTKLTLGREFKNVSPEALLAASQKVLRSNKKEAKPDDTESLVYKSIYGPEDFFKETITKGSGQTLWKIKNRINTLNGHNMSVQDAFPHGALSPPLYSNLNSSSLVSVTQDSNPLSLNEAANRITAFGPGGVTSTHAIPESLRNIHTSQIGFLDPVRTPESDKAGIDLQLSSSVKKYGNTLKTVVVNKKGARVLRSPAELQGATVAFPGQAGLKTVEAVRDGQLVTVRRDKVDYEVPDSESMFSQSTNLVPFLSNNAGARANLAGKMSTQALSLKHREAPLVQAASDADGKTMEQLAANDILPHSPVNGSVVSVSKDLIRIKDGNGNVHDVGLYDNYAIGGKNYINSEPKVKKGDEVEFGQLLAESNYTSNGTLALGVNLKTAYVPFKGLTFEDGIGVLESVTAKMTSQHMYRFDLAITENTVIDKNMYLAYFPGKITPTQVGKLDDRGIIKPGVEVDSGDCIIAAMREEIAGPEDVLLGKLNRKLVRPYRDISVLWEKDNKGTVVDVIINPRNVTVSIRTDAPLVVGDKITNRAGGKGVVTAILPASEMPKDSKGNAYEIIINPATVISRMNVGQLLETAASKTASPGKPYIAPSFPGGNVRDVKEKVKKDLDRHGVKETDMVYDASGKEIGNIFAGNQYFYKLGKTTDTNFSARAFQGGYDADMQPVRGGDEGSKGMGLLDMYALLSHNARNILRESVTSKSEYNPEMFKAIQMGKPLPPPQPTFAFNKFINYLKGAGVNVEKNGDRFKLLPLTDSDVMKLSSGGIKNAKMLKAKDMSEESGGLFDINKTGGRIGNKWSHVEMAEPVLSPVFVEPARRLLGLKRKEILGLQYEHGGGSIKELLAKIDVDKRTKELSEGVDKLKGVKKDDAIKQIKYLKVLKEAGMKPEEAYVISKLPVIPPVFRPIYPTEKGNYRVGDVNNLYKQVIVVNEGLRAGVLSRLPGGEKTALRRELFNSVKALQGLDKPGTGKDFKGFIMALKGNTPKEGYFQSKVLAKKQDIAGRATIGGDPSLGIDEVKLPDKMAWTLYGPFVIRELVKLGMPVKGAQEELEMRTDKARSALVMVMRERPVLLNRAPTLHKFNIMAFKPTPYPGKTLLIPPMVMKPFNADVDGDAMQVHVPVTEEARREALENMMPSQNLFSVLDKSPHYVPSNEAVFGLYQATKGIGKKPTRAPKNYTSEKDVVKDVEAGRLKYSDPVKLNNIITTAGSVCVNSVLPPDLKDYGRIITKKSLSELLLEVGRRYPEEYSKITKKLKNLGDGYAYDESASFSFKDFETPVIKKEVLARAEAAIRKGGNVVDVYGKAQTELIDGLMAEGARSGNKFYEWVASGARGNASQLASIWGAPMLVEDIKNRVVPKAITRGFIEGLTPSEYFTSLFGTRKAITATKLSVVEPGALAKELVASNIDLVVTMIDCGTRRGIDFGLYERDALDRLLAVDVRAGSGVVLAKRNDLVDSRMFDRLREAGVKTVKVRSVTTCEAPKGICASCSGIQENGSLPVIGENLGVKHSMSIAEPLTQIALSAKHTAGVKGRDIGIAGFKTTLEMPSSPLVKEVLARVDGEIKGVKKLPAGGYSVSIKPFGKLQPMEHLVPASRTLLRKTGRVARGDALTDGIPNISGFVDLNGIDAGRQKLTDTIMDYYKKSGTSIDRRVPETIARGMLNFARIKDPGDYEFVSGDIVEYNQTLPMQSKKTLMLPAWQASGYRLAKRYGNIEQGTKVDNSVIRGLRRHKNVRGDRIRVYKDPVSVEPVAFGINKIPLMKNDWMSRMGFRYISNTITDAAATGAESNIHSLNPIPALSYGAEFGLGVDLDVY